jgi:hypothetical protein
MEPTIGGINLFPSPNPNSVAKHRRCESCKPNMVRRDVWIPETGEALSQSETKQRESSKAEFESLEHEG